MVTTLDKARRLLKTADNLCDTLITLSDDNAFNYQDCSLCSVAPGCEHRRSCPSILALHLRMKIERFLVETENESK